VLNARLSLLAKSLLVLLSMATALLTGTVTAAVEDEIAARLQPAGTVCVMGQSCAAGMSAASAGAAGARSPETVYNTFCQACHNTGVNNAPKLADVAAWAPRIAKGIDVLYTSALQGFNNGTMPLRGTCMDCSDDDLRATVDYLVQAAK
jgi:cytochrome c5